MSTTYMSMGRLFGCSMTCHGSYTAVSVLMLIVVPIAKI